MDKKYHWVRIINLTYDQYMQASGFKKDVVSHILQMEFFASYNKDIEKWTMKHWPLDGWVDNSFANWQISIITEDMDPNDSGLTGSEYQIQNLQVIDGEEKVIDHLEEETLKDRLLQVGLIIGAGICLPIGIRWGSLLIATQKNWNLDFLDPQEHRWVLLWLSGWVCIMIIFLIGLIIAMIYAFFQWVITGKSWMSK